MDCRGVVGGAAARVVARSGRGVGAECGGDPSELSGEPFELGDLGLGGGDLGLDQVTEAPWDGAHSSSPNKASSSMISSRDSPKPLARPMNDISSMWVSSKQR